MICRECHHDDGKRPAYDAADQLWHHRCAHCHVINKYSPNEWEIILRARTNPTDPLDPKHLDEQSDSHEAALTENPPLWLAKITCPNCLQTFDIYGDA